MSVRIKTSKEAIANYWSYRLEDFTNVTIETAQNHCWRCRIQKRLDRCHIIATALGGEDTPANFVLLCKHCHIASPDVLDENFMWLWLRAYKTDLTFWVSCGIDELEKMGYYDIKNLVKKDPDLFNENLAMFDHEVVHHFGQPRYNPSSAAYLILKALKEMNLIQ